MKIFHAAAKLDAGADEKHDINFHWPYLLQRDIRNREIHSHATLQVVEIIGI